VKEIGFYPRYDRLGASSRYRFFMFFKRWRQLHESDQLALYPGMSDQYLKTLYARGSVSKFRQLKEFWHLYRRAHKLTGNLIIEYELVPFLSYAKEKRLIGSRKYILNYDDNVWEKYKHDRRLQDKFDSLCKNAAGVIVANRFLEEKVRKLNDNVCLIPTVLDLDEYDCGAIEKFERFTLVWIGTPVTYTYLEQHLEALQLMTASGCRLLVIADKELGRKRPLVGVDAEYVSWSEQTEKTLLLKSHVGIMPLTDDAFSRGKSAFKLLQYQAAELPLIASPVGENNYVVEQGKNGFLAETPQQWLQALNDIRRDPALYERCSQYSRQKAYDYSLQKYFPVFYEFVNTAFNIKD